MPILRRPASTPANLASERIAGYMRLNEVMNNRARPLKFGVPDDNDAIRTVQKSLIDLGFSMPVSMRASPGFGMPDGNYGTETRQTVARFQGTRGLQPDGVVGLLTLKALDSSFAVFSVVLMMTDLATGASLGPLFLNISSPTPPGNLGGYRWPTAPGFPGLQGNWFWSSSVAP